MEQTMKAIVQESYGSTPDVLQLREIARPVVGDDDVLVRVHAAGVDQGVWHLMAGMPYVMRLAGFGLRAPKSPVRGYNVAGRVEAFGAKVTSFRPGDDVFGTCRRLDAWHRRGVWRGLDMSVADGHTRPPRGRRRRAGVELV